MWDATPSTGGEWSLAQLVPTSPAPTISTDCPESSTLAIPSSTSLHPTPQQLSNTEFPSCWTYIYMGTRSFPSVPIPGVTNPFFPRPCFHSSAKILTQSPANPHLTSKSHPHTVPSQLAQQILFSSFPNAHQLSPQFCCSVFPMHEPALCQLPTAKLLPRSPQSASQPPTPTTLPSPAHQICRSFFF